MRNMRPFVILSASQPNDSHALASEQASGLREQLYSRKLFPLEIRGQYEGQFRTAYLVTLPGNGQAGYALSQIASLAKHYGQASVLYVDSSRYAGLYSPANGWSLQHIKELGQWREAPAEQAQRGDYWYHDGRYFVIW